MRLISFTMMFCILALYAMLIAARNENEQLRSHVQACRNELDGMIPLCWCEDRDTSIESSCTRAEYTHYEVLWNAEHVHDM